MKKKILAICGSIRSESSNLGVLLALEKLVGENAEFELFPIASLPHFNPDLALPASVLSFKEKLKASDALVISTPEYAHGVPGVLKNALDWIVSDEDFPGKKVGVIIASTSAGDFAKTSFLEVLRTMSAQVNEEMVITISGVRSKILQDGALLAFDSSCFEKLLQQL